MHNIHYTDACVWWQRLIAMSSSLPVFVLNSAQSHFQFYCIANIFYDIHVHTGWSRLTLLWSCNDRTINTTYKTRFYEYILIWCYYAAIIYVVILWYRTSSNWYNIIEVDRIVICYVGVIKGRIRGIFESRISHLNRAAYSWGGGGGGGFSKYSFALLFSCIVLLLCMR